MTTALRITEVSRRSGFPAPTLRYYEQVGLLSPPARTPAGYRAYDEAVLARLAVIARAKALDCSLEEIRQLMPEWDGGRCAPVQARLRAVAAARLVEAEARTEELLAFTDDLRRILDSLGSHTPAGPCDDECGCLVEPASSDTALRATTPVEGTLRDRPAEESPAITCTLDGEQLPGRIQDWKELLVHVIARSPLDGGMRLEFDDVTPVEKLVRLVEAERSCCGFFAFTLTLDDRGVGLEVRAPSTAQGIVEALFGPA